MRQLEGLGLVALIFVEDVVRRSLVVVNGGGRVWVGLRLGLTVHRLRSHRPRAARWTSGLLLHLLLGRLLPLPAGEARADGLDLVPGGY